MKGNYLLLDKEQLKVFNDRYEFIPSELGILTKTRNYKRVTLHPYDEDFQAIATVNGRKLTFRITKRAISFWMDPNYSKKYTLIDIQNVINDIIIHSMCITDEDIIKRLEK